MNRLSGGRMRFGVGAGWNLDEMRNHGADPKHRFGILRERVEAMKEIWTQDEAEYHGKYVDFDPIFCWPKPIQEGRPPILVGGNGATVFDRVLAYGDVWMPNRIAPDEPMIARVEEFVRTSEASERGRLPLSTSRCRRPIYPSSSSYEKAGVTRAVHMLPALPPDEVEAKLDEYVARRETYQGAAA